MDRVARIRRQLSKIFAPTTLEVTDKSDLHNGHAGAQGGGGHFDIVIVSESFKGHNPVSRHRMIYKALGNLMPSEIHALSINACSTDEL